MPENLVYAIYPDDVKAQDAIRRLEAAGVTNIEAHPLTEADGKWIRENSQRNTDSLKAVYAGTAVGIGVGEMIGLAAGLPLGPAVAMGTATAGGAAGGVAGALIGNAFGNRDETAAEEYIGQGVLVSVHCPEENVSEVKKQLGESGALCRRAVTLEERVPAAQPERSI